MPERFQAGLINISQESVENYARDAAEERITESRENLKRQNFLSRAFHSVWTYGMARNFNRNREIARARQAIHESGNLYENEGHSQTEHSEAMDSLVERFVQQNEELNETLVDTEQGERKVALGNSPEETQFRTDMIDLLKRYAADDSISKEDFENEKDEIIERCFANSRPEVLGNGALYADNFAEIADHIRYGSREGRDLNELTDNVDFILGNAKAGLKSEAQRNTVDRLVERMSRSPIGQFVTPETMAGAVAIASGIAEISGRAVAKSIPLVGAPLAGALTAFVKERHELQREVTQHRRGRASGKTITPDSPRRERMEEFRYEMRGALELTEELEDRLLALNSPDATEADIEELIRSYVEVEARSDLSSRNNIDLIAYTSVNQLERERTRLELARAHARVKIRNTIASLDAPPAFLGGQRTEDYLSVAIQDRQRELSGEISAVDRNFERFRNGQALGSSLKGLAVGLLVGEVVHEAVAFGTGHMTHIEYLGHLLNKDLPKADLPGVPTVLPDGHTHVNLPSGYHLEQNGNGTYDLINDRTHHPMASNLHFTQDGRLTDESVESLKQHGVAIHEEAHTVQSVTNESRTFDSKEYVEHNKENFEHIHRAKWYDNDTPHKFDKNELRMDIQKKGDDILIKVDRMRPHDSYHHGDHKDPRELAKEGKLFVQFCLSKETQNDVYALPVRPDGTIDLPPDHPAAKLFFDTHGNELGYKFKFAETVVAGGEKDGVPIFNSLATVVGHGTEHIDTTIPVPSTTSVVETYFDVPAEYHVDPPLVIPFQWRTPLEPLQPNLAAPVQEDENAYARRYGDRYSPGDKEQVSDISVLKANAAMALRTLENLKVAGSPAEPEIEKLKASLLANPTPQEAERVINSLLDMKIIDPATGTKLSFKEGARFMPQEFYDTSPFVKGLNRANEVVIMLKDMVGDTVLTAALVDAIHQYCTVTGQTKRIVLQTKHAELLKGYEKKYPGVVIEAPHEVPVSDDRYIIDGNIYRFRTGDNTPINPIGNDDLEHIMSVDHFVWVSDEGHDGHMPDPAENLDQTHAGRQQTVYRNLPGAIVRNIEMMTGVKLYDGLADRAYELPSPSGDTAETQAATESVKEKYGLEPDDKYMVLACASSIFPKMFSPGKWRQVIDGLLDTDPDGAKLMLIKPTGAKLEEYTVDLDRELQDLPKEKREKIVWVEESLKGIADLVSGSELTITPDTGIGHMSAALGTKTLMVMSTSNPTVWSVPNQNLNWVMTRPVRKLMRPNERRIHYNKAFDAPGYYADGIGGMEALEADVVVKKAQQMLA